MKWTPESTYLVIITSKAPAGRMASLVPGIRMGDGLRLSASGGGECIL